MHWLTLALVLAGYAGVYLLRARRLSATGRPVPPRRTAAFLAGLLVLGAAVSAPAEHLAERSFPAHMAQHLLVADVAALLIVLGLTRPLLAPLLRAPLLRHLRVLGHPGAAILVWVANLWLWHLPAAYQGALGDGALHAAQHGMFLIAGLALWMPLLGPLPRPAWFGNLAQIGYVLVVRLAGFLLANVFAWSGTRFYPGYASLDEQSAAGAVMAVEESVVMVAVLGWLAFRWLRDAGERQDLAELAARRGQPVDGARIARAVAAGRGGDLRRRLEESAQ